MRNVVNMYKKLLGYVSKCINSSKLNCSIFSIRLVSKLRRMIYRSGDKIDMIVKIVLLEFDSKRLNDLFHSKLLGESMPLFIGLIIVILGP